MQLLVKHSPRKYALLVNFANKALELIRTFQVLILPRYDENSPIYFIKRGNIPMVTYQLGDIVINKISSYKELVNLVFVGEKVSFSLNIKTRKCEHSQFWDPNHKDVIHGDVHIVKNFKLMKMPINDLNHRKLRI